MGSSEHVVHCAAITTLVRAVRLIDSNSEKSSSSKMGKETENTSSEVPILGTTYSILTTYSESAVHSSPIEIQ